MPAIGGFRVPIFHSERAPTEKASHPFAQSEKAECSDKQFGGHPANLLRVPEFDSFNGDLSAVEAGLSRPALYCLCQNRRNIANGVFRIAEYDSVAGGNAVFAGVRVWIFEFERFRSFLFII